MDKGVSKVNVQADKREGVEIKWPPINLRQEDREIKAEAVVSY